MIQIIMITLFIILVRREYKNEQKEYRQKYGMSKKEFLAMRKRMNPEGKTSLRQWIQDLAKN
jgi:hypothetical protein